MAAALDDYAFANMSNPKWNSHSVSVEVQRQSGTSDCGMVALDMLLTRIGGTPATHDLWRVMGAGHHGNSVYELVSAAQQLGFEADALYAPANRLDELDCPAILHLRHGHFVVLEAVAEASVAIVDPASGRENWPRAVLAEQYSGVAIVVRQDEKNIGPIKSNDLSLFLAVWREAPSLVLVSLLAVVHAACWIVLSVALPSVFASQGTAFDIESALLAAFIALGVLIVADLGMARMNQDWIQRIGSSMVAEFIRAVGSTHPGYLSTRAPRFLEYSVTTLDPLYASPAYRPIALYRILELPVLVVAIAFADARFAVCLLGACVAYGIMAWLQSRYALKTHRSLLEASHEQLRSLTENIGDLARTGGFDRQIENWLRARNAAHKAVGTRRAQLDQVEYFLLALSTVVVFLGSSLGSRGTLLDSVERSGTLLLGIVTFGIFGYVASSLRAMLEWSIGARGIQTLRRAAIAECEASMKSSAEDSLIALDCIQLEVSSSAGDPGIVTNISFRLSRGEAAAIIGGKNSGKTSIADCLLGLRDFQQGRLYIGGVPIFSGRAVRRVGLIAGVTDTIQLPDGTLGRYLGSGNSEDATRVKQHLVGLGIDSLLESLPMGLGTMVIRGGRGFSASDRRLLAIARCLMSNPSVLVLDGVIDQLDAACTNRMLNYISQLGIAVVITTAREENVPAYCRKFSIVEHTLVGHERSAVDTFA